MSASISPVISVIVPIYNVREFLDQCLASIATQSFRDFEVLCVNDGSTDGSVDIIRRYSHDDSRFVLLDKVNGGYGSACNFGLERARGDWISIIEPDDWIEPTMFEDMVSFARGFRSDVDIVKTSWTDVDQWDDPRHIRFSPGYLSGRLPDSSSPAPVIEMPVLLEGHPSIWTCLYRRAFLMDNAIRFNEYPGAGWADNPFYIEVLCRANSIVFLDHRYYNYRRELNRPITRTVSDSTLSIPFDRWNDMMDIIEDLGVDNEDVLAAMHLRGVNYAFDAARRFGADNGVIKAKTAEVFSRMNPDIVLSHPKISSSKKRAFCTVTGAPYKPRAAISRFRYLVSELVFRLRSKARR